MHWEAPSADTRKPGCVVRFEGWGQCQKQASTLMRSGAVWSEERESKMLPWTGLGGRATTQVPSSCGLPAPGCSIHINHSVITTPSRCAVHNLHNCMSQTLRPVVFVLLSWALVPPRYMEGITCRPGWSRHTSFFLHLSIVLSIRIHHYFTPSHINSLSPSQNYLCVWTLGFKQNLLITTLNLSQIFKKNFFFMEEGSLPASSPVACSAVLHICSSPWPTSSGPSATVFPWWMLLFTTHLKYSDRLLFLRLQNFFPCDQHSALLFCVFAIRGNEGTLHVSRCPRPFIQVLRYSVGLLKILSSF